MSEEFFTNNFIKKIILTNKIITEKRQQPFEVNKEILGRILQQVKEISDDSDERTRIIKLAAILLGGIAFEQPFAEGNKETSITITIYYLRKNNLNLPILTEQDEDKLIELLQRTILKFEGDDTIISEVESYLDGKVISM